MNYKDIQKEKAAEREEVSRKIAAGQSFEEHAQEKSLFDLEDLRNSHIVIHADGEEHVLHPKRA